MKIGCFALVEPFTPMEHQFKLIKNMGIEYADLTDSHDGASLGAEFGFAATISLDSHPQKIREMLGQTGIQLSSVCAHANLLDPTSPDVYGTAQIIKAIRLAHQLGIHQVITTEGDPKTPFGHSLSAEQRIFSICEKLYQPILWAEELGISLLIETHGIVSDNVDTMEHLLGRLGHEKTVGICLDTGNSWLGGANPLDYIKKMPHRIQHIHWKDLGADMIPKRGKLYGCGMGSLPLGDGVIGIKEIVEALKNAHIDVATTLEIAGANNVRCSAERLRLWWNPA